MRKYTVREYSPYLSAQYEAANVLGYMQKPDFYTYNIPSDGQKGNSRRLQTKVITLVKDTSLAFAISYAEMFTIAKQIAAAQTNIMPLFIAGVFYFVFNFIVAHVMEKIEKKLNYYH